MRRALELASKARGYTSPNPLVGAVIVRDNQIIAEGYHHAYGQDHAEVNALKNATESVQGATMYVNLEPCCVHGNTPPCTKAILQAGIQKVVIGMHDPNPKVNGQGIAELQKNGVEVVENILLEECLELNKIFVHNQKTKTPFVALKGALTMDGKIGKRGEQTAISSREALIFAHALRQEYDAILVGSETVLTDNPRLDIRHQQGNKQPLRVCLDKHKRVNKKYQICRDDKHILCQDFPLLPNGQFDLQKIMQYLYQEKNICSVLVEGGAQTWQSFCEQKIPQQGYFIIAPHFLGEQNTTPAFQKINFDFVLKNRQNLGNNVAFIGKFKF